MRMPPASRPHPLIAVVITLICVYLSWLQLSRGVKVDGTTLGLFAIAVVSWLFPFIESFKAGPAGIEIKRLIETVEETKAAVETTKIHAVEAERAAKVAQIVSTSGVGKRPAVRLVETPAESRDADDPLAGQFGGSAHAKGFALSAKVTAVPSSSDLFEVVLTVRAGSQSLLDDGTPVRFHLHPTFVPSVTEVAASGGEAQLTRYAWGAFTVGVEIPTKNVRLELALASLPDAPALFKKR
jgi:hypothetical protein